MKYLFGLYLTFSVFFSSLILLSYQNAVSVLFSASEKQTLSFSFRDEVTQNFVEQTAESLKTKYKIHSYTLYSPADQYSEFSKSFTMYNQGTFNAEEIIKLIPYSIDFNFSIDQNTAEIKKLLISENIFQETGTAQNWLDKLKTIATAVENFGRFLFLFVFLTTSMMTVATIRILFENNKSENKIRSYLGDSFKSIITQYFLKILGLCVFSFCAGLLLTFVTYQLLLFKLQHLSEFNFLYSRLHFLNINSTLLIAFGFVCAFLLGFYFASRQLYSRIYDEE